MCRIKIKNSDAKATLTYLYGKVYTNPTFYYKFNVDKESLLANLFWVDSTSQLDYACFRDMLHLIQHIEPMHIRICFSFWLVLNITTKLWCLVVYY